MISKFKKNRLEIKYFRDYTTGVKIIILSVIAMMMILICIYFIKTYVNKKQSILFDLQTEAVSLETNFIQDISYSSHFISLILGQIQGDYKNIKHISKILQDYANLSNFNMIFGWRKYSFVDSDFKEVATSLHGIKKDPLELPYIKQIIEEDNWQDRKLRFYARKTTDKNDSLKVIANISQKFSKKYVGSLILSYDIATIIRRLNSLKKNRYTNFIVLDNNLEIVAQSKATIDKIIVNTKLTQDMVDVLKRLDNSENISKEISYLDMLSGLNYYIKKVNDLPFLLIINLDTSELKSDILDSVIRKFIEIAVFTAVFLFIIITIFRRETWLRAKAERATIIATKAAKTKSEFLAFTAHEIRSPLGFILTGSEIMTKELLGTLSQEYKNYAEGIHHNSKIILDFLTDILDENQIMEGKFKILNSIENLETIINQAITVNKARFNKRSVEIILNWDQHLPRIICDQRRIFQVMSNLISNGIKYSKDNTTINIKGYVVNDNLEIQFIDQGIGMSKEDVKAALSTHEVVRGVYHSLIDSYGLGLPIVKMLLDIHEAKLLITSEENIGTIVTVVFPKFKLVYGTVFEPKMIV